MNVTVKLFAVLKERAGTGALAVELPEGATADTAMTAAADRTGIGDLLQRMRVAVAVNREFAAGNTPLRDGDEVALIPPVSGG